MKTLLEIAKAVKHNAGRNMIISDEMIELAVAWAKDEITLTQVGVALRSMDADKAKGAMTGTAYVTLAIALRQAVRRGILKYEQH